MKAKRYLLGVISVALLLAVTACGGSDAEDTSSTNPPVSTFDAFVNFVQSFIVGSPDDTEPVAIDTTVVTAPEESEPLAL